MDDRLPPRFVALADQIQAEMQDWADRQVIGNVDPEGSIALVEDAMRRIRERAGIDTSGEIMSTTVDDDGAIQTTIYRLP